MTEPELIEYFNEHVLYELLMLRYSKAQLEQAPDQFLWNAMFAAFNVSARNLYEFLKGKSDISVTQFAPYRSAVERLDVSPVRDTYQKLHRQCFHMGERTKEAVGKISLERVEKFAIWVESSMQDLMASFSEGFRSQLDLTKADRFPQPPPLVYKSGPTGPGLILQVAQATATATTATPGQVHTTRTIPPNQGGHK